MRACHLRRVDDREGGKAASDKMRSASARESGRPDLGLRIDDERRRRECDPVRYAAFPIMDAGQPAPAKREAGQREP